MKKLIQVGETAPAIHSTDLWGQESNVPTKGKWIYLSFHRFAACPFCNLRTNELIRNHERFKEHQVAVISIWPSDKTHLLRHAASEKPPFSMLSDRDKTIYKAYGVTQSSFIGGIKLMGHPQLVVNALKNKFRSIRIDADPNLMPASFLIDPDGIIRMAHYGKHFGDHPKIEDILERTKA